MSFVPPLRRRSLSQTPFYFVVVSRFARLFPFRASLPPPRPLAIVPLYARGYSPVDMGGVGGLGGGNVFGHFSRCHYLLPTHIIGEVFHSHENLSLSLAYLAIRMYVCVCCLTNIYS